MNFANIQGNGLIISITLTLLVGAMIVYYLNSKIVTLERTVARQNTVLTNFVSNIRNELAGPSLTFPSGPVSNDATEEAKEKILNVSLSTETSPLPACQINFIDFLLIYCIMQ